MSENDCSNMNNFVNSSGSSKDFKTMMEQHFDAVKLFCLINKTLCPGFFLPFNEKQATMGTSLGTLLKEQEPIEYQENNDRLMLFCFP